MSIAVLPPIAQPEAMELDGDSILACLTLWQAARAVGVKPTTRKFYAEVIETIKRHLPGLDRPPAHLNEVDLAEFAQSVGHYAPSRWNAMVTILRHVTGRKDLLRYRKLRFRDFKPPRQEEFAELLVECDMASKSYCGLIVRFLSLTGLRINEARKLRWVDVGEDALNLPADITKNGRPRSVPLLPGAREVLSRLKGARNGDLVLPCVDIRTALRKACQRAGWKPVSYHWFRHYFATSCIASGVDMPTVSRWMGHSDGGALLGRTYFHLADHHSQRMAEKVRIAV